MWYFKENPSHHVLLPINASISSVFSFVPKCSLTPVFPIITSLFPSGKPQVTQ